MAVSAAFNKPFDEQVAFFRQKLNVGTLRWDDIMRSAHDHAFIVAGAMKADLVQDFRFAIDKAIAEGKSIQWFRQEFDAIVAKNGWTGWKGEGSVRGRDWRTRIIYQTNMSTSYAAGRWAQLNDPDLLMMRPYWRYVHSDGVRHPRPHHLSWNGTTLPHDDAFWQTHFAPNGWGCHCRIEAASQADFNSAKADGKGNRPSGWDKRDPKTGEPVGIDKGFGYAPGASVKPQLLDAARQKLEKYEPKLASALTTTLVQSPAFKHWYDSPVGRWPMVKISQEDAGLIGSKETVAQFSAETAIKQKDNHSDLTAEDYVFAQYAVDNHTHKIQDSDNSLIYIWDARSEEQNGFVVVVKSTQTGKGLFFNSYRKLSKHQVKKDDEIMRLLSKGRGR